jgi:hypothetical protein
MRDYRTYLKFTRLSMWASWRAALWSNVPQLKAYWERRENEWYNRAIRDGLGASLDA